MELIEQLKGVLDLHPVALLFLFCMGLGVILKRSRRTKDDNIPMWLGLVGFVTYPLLALANNHDYTAGLLLRNAMLGAIFGWGSVGAHQLIKQKFPGLSWLIPSTGDTEQFKRPDK